MLLLFCVIFKICIFCVFGPKCKKKDFKNAFDLSSHEYEHFKNGKWEIKKGSTTMKKNQNRNVTYIYLKFKFLRESLHFIET